jgi:hypothetical protein
MWKWLLPARHTGSTLTRQFGILSLVVTILTTASLCLVITYFLRKDLLEREWHVTADYIRTEATQHLGPSDFADPHSSQAATHFETFYHQVVLMPEIVRVKITTPTWPCCGLTSRGCSGSAFPTTCTCGAR